MKGIKKQDKEREVEEQGVEGRGVEVEGETVGYFALVA